MTHSIIVKKNYGEKNDSMNFRIYSTMPKKNPQSCPAVRCDGEEMGLSLFPVLHKRISGRSECDAL